MSLSLTRAKGESIILRHRSGDEVEVYVEPSWGHDKIKKEVRLRFIDDARNFEIRSSELAPKA